MIQTIQLIKFFYPFIILAVFFCLYKKEYSFNQRFYWCMTMYFNARRLFAFLTVGLLIFMNWCCYVTNPNYAVFFPLLSPAAFSLTEWQKPRFTGCMRERASGLLHSCLPWYSTPYLTCIAYSLCCTRSVWHRCSIHLNVCFASGTRQTASAIRPDCFSESSATTTKLPLVCGILSEHTCSKNSER